MRNLRSRAKTRTKLHAAVSPPEYGWVGAGAGKSGLSFVYTITQHGGTAKLYIDRGDAEENQSVFDSLREHKDEIEAAYGGDLSWEPLEGKRGCRIAVRLDIGGYRDEDKWGEVQEAMVERMIRLEHALHPFIAKLHV
jgi:Domain of unknown function (DUF4268)